MREVARKSSRPISETIQGSPLVLIVVYDPRKRAPASKGDFLGILSLGCVLENMWLEAEALGLCLQVMSVFSSKQVESNVKRILEIPRHMKIAYAVRLGYPITRSKYLRVRRDEETLLAHNKYESKGFD